VAVLPAIDFSEIRADLLEINEQMRECHRETSITDFAREAAMVMQQLESQRCDRSFASLCDPNKKPTARANCSAVGHASSMYSASGSIGERRLAMYFHPETSVKDSLASMYFR
jgi:hypothetical protein